MKKLLLTTALSFLAVGSAIAQTRAANVGKALGDAMVDLGRQWQEQDDRLAAIQKQHDLEVERLKLEYQLRAAEQERYLAAKYGAAPPAQQAPKLQTQKPAWEIEVDAAYPGWRQMVATVGFRAWYAKQPPEFHKQPAIFTLDAYSRDMRILERNVNNPYIR